MEKSIALLSGIAKTTALPEEHKLEQVAVINEIVFVNDSKSVSIKQTVESINTINGELILIIGGDDSKTDYLWLLNADIDKLKAIVYLGRKHEALLNILKNFKGLYIRSEGMEEALQIAFNYAKKDQIILFSPACPSYDAFDNYKNRGLKFKSAVLQMQ